MFPKWDRCPEVAHSLKKEKTCYAFFFAILVYVIGRIGVVKLLRVPKMRLLS